jgi:hypothetical protein
VRAWEYEIDHGAARFITYSIKTAWRNQPVREMTLPEGLVPIARVRTSSIDVSHPEQAWERGDDIVFLSRHLADSARALLDAAHPTAHTESQPRPQPTL